MKRVLLLSAIGVIYCTYLNAQNVFNPLDPIVRHNPNAALGSSQNPNPNIGGLQKWVSTITNGVSTGSNSFDASSFKAYFLNLNGAKYAFRIKFPKSYSNPDSVNKKYPSMLFFHGAGEPGCPNNGGIYNNEKQLVHGGNYFRQAVDNNQFDGFLIYPQTVVTSGCWSDWGAAPWSPAYDVVIGMLDSLAKYAKLDVDRVFVNGLSNGGGATFAMTATYPQRVAKIAPSAAVTGYTNWHDFVHIPIWFATGERDSNPNPASGEYVYNNIKNAGGDVVWTLYAGLGHGVWSTHWNEPNYLPYMNDMHKANPLVYFQRYEWCPGEPISAKIGITRGYYQYEWRKGSTTIATATATSTPSNPPTNTNLNYSLNIIDPSSIIAFIGNDITVNSYGTYSVRFKRTSTSAWSSWSPKPAVISQKATTQTPPIQIAGIRSKVLPAPDGSTLVPLELPAGYFGYEWVRVSDNAIVSTTRTYNAPPGVYKARVREQFGCGALFSPDFSVVNAAGSPKPDPAKNLTAAAISQTSIQLDWNENPNSGENETGFEIYRATSATGPFQLVNITNPDAVTFVDAGLASNTRYYYLVRAVGLYGAANNTNIVSALTMLDDSAPTSPSGLTVTCASRTSITLSWQPSSDNVGVYRYDIYVNGTKLHSTSSTSYTIHALSEYQTYNFSVKARDAAGNLSPASNLATGSTYLQGLCYKYYEGTWDLLPDFNTLSPESMGITPNVDISLATQGEFFGFLWQGYIKIPDAGTYTFYTTSDDGSKLYIGEYNAAATPVVNNDGLHGQQEISGTYNFPSAGIYPIAITMFEKTGDQVMSISWQNLAAGISKAVIPNSAFSDTYTYPGTVPNKPGDVTATAVSYKQITVSWGDNSSDETGFEIARAAATGPFVSIATVGAGVTSYNDTTLSPSTLYRYKVRAINAYGASAYAGATTLGYWRGNNTWADEIDGSHNLTLPGGSANPSFSSTEKREGSHSIVYDGTADYNVINGTGSGGWLGGTYNQRTVGAWIRPLSTNVANRLIWEIGGSDDGMALAINNNTLVAGVASGNARSSISTPFNSLAWNYVEVVYYQNSLRLLLNGAEVASATLPFNSIGTTTSDSRVGGSSSSNAFNSSTTGNFYHGHIDALIIYTDAAATTLAPFAPPTTPTSLTAQAVSTQAINLNWVDQSGSETGFEIWRSVGNNSNYRLISTQPAGTTSFADVALFANVTYYYKVRAKGAVNYSAFTGEANATTFNTKPVLNNIMAFTMRYGTTFTMPISATDVDGDPLTFTTKYLPSFGSVQNVSNGNANLVFTPSITQLGGYTIIVYVSDGHESDTTQFYMQVNSNRIPTLQPVANVTIDEGSEITIPLSANDPEGNSTFQWTFGDKPSFVTFTNLGNGSGSLRVAPGYAASGVYTMTVYADDGAGAWASRTFTITVNEKDPNEKIQVNFRFATGNVPGWNDVTAPFSFNNLITSKGITTGVDLAIQSGSPAAGGPGQVTGNNSGVYPDNVISDYMKWGNDGAADIVQLKVSGLDQAKRYNFVFFSSDICNYCFLDSESKTTFQIGSETASVKYYLNTSVTDTIYNVQPNGSGEVLITMTGDPRNYMGGVLNAMVIDAVYDDGTVPAKPLNLTATYEQNEGVKLRWVDRSYNERTYKVFRATSIAGPYTLLNPGATNVDDTTYNDQNVAPYSQYYYFVRGSNAIGDGTSSDTVNVTTGNNLPNINQLDHVFVKTDATVQEDFSVSDDAGDAITVTIPNKPAFVTLTNLGGNNYRITAAPTISNLGWFYLNVTATDDKGGVRTKVMTISVADKNTRSVFVNLGSFGKTAPRPWNNLLGPGANNSLNDLVDESNTPTTIDVMLVSGWAGTTDLGHITGNNSGIVPDSVLASGLYSDNTNPHQINITGLDNTKRYNLAFIGSQNEGMDASTKFTVGSQSVVLNARNNTNRAANLNGIAPVGGSITVTVSKETPAAFMYLNGIIIEEYASAATVINPVHLYAEPIDESSVLLTWSDRSNNETGFVLERATNASFTGATTINLPANTTSHTNTGLSPNTKYWYRVRAANGSLGYSNVVRTITSESIVLVNFNFAVPSAPAPWNNTQALPTHFNTFANLTNMAGVNTGISLSIERLFNGEFNAGMNTGNNSGVVPDRVLEANYWIDNIQLSQMRVKGLNHTKRYRFGFTGSASPFGWFPGNYTATYTINDRTVYLNAWQNTTKIVYIGDVVPDANGEVLLNFSTTEAATFGFNAGVIIHAYDDASGGTVPNTPNFGEQNQVDEVVVQSSEQPSGTEKLSIQMYPNPFVEFVNIDFNNTSASNRLRVDVFDLTGRLVYRHHYGTMPQGFNTLRLNTEDGRLNTGTYLFTLNINGKPVQTGKLIKTLK